MFGLLNLHKPTGLTSRQVVNRVQRLVRPLKAGHAGTLDPLATGVLIVCVGPATRLIEYVQRMPKRYLATFLLGQQSPTDDVEGEVTPFAGAVPEPIDVIQRAAEQFVGRIEQRPPAFSAVHVDGKRAYDLARRGKEFELAPRPVEVHALGVTRYEYPELELDIECGSGTYVRSLGRDLAEALGTRAVMSALVRSAIGPFTLEKACPLDELSGETLNQWLRSPLEALAMLPTIELDEDEERRVRQGQRIARTTASSDSELAAIDGKGKLVAILTRRDDGRFGPTIGFPPGD